MTIPRLTASMTPEERARYPEAYATWENCKHEAEVSGETCLACIAKAIHAAEARRDALWRKALERSHYDYIDGPHVSCEDCALLVSLLASAAPQVRP